MAEQTPTTTATSPSAAPAAPTAEAPQTPPADGQATPAEAEKKPADDVGAKRFAALRAQERKLQAQRDAIKAEREALEPWKKAKEATATNPLAALEALGLTYEQLTDAVLATMGQGQAQEPTPEQIVAKTVEEKLAAWQAEQAKAKATEEQARITRTFEATKAEIARTAQAAGDKYELTNALGAHNQAWEHIEQTFYKTGALPTIEQALEHVEATLEAEAKAILALKKFSAHRPAEAQAGARPETTGSPTLTNRALAEVSALQRDSRPANDDESVKRAAALLKWT